MRQAKDDSEIPGTVAYESARADRLQDRVEALEAALRKIADLIDSEADDPLDDAIRIASRALAPQEQQDK